MVEIAHSGKTDTFDVTASISEDWYTPFNTPIGNMYFIDRNDINETCESSPGDGKCDQFLNRFDFQYDGGDCCASTCKGDLCGWLDDSGVEVQYPFCEVVRALKCGCLYGRHTARCFCWIAMRWH